MPCLIVLYVLQNLLYLVAIGNWFVALFPAAYRRACRRSACSACASYADQRLSPPLTPRYPAFGEAPGTLPMDQAALPPVP